MKILSFLLLFLYSLASNAVVKRHDIPAENYLLETSPEYLIDMPHEGHGVLIDPQWVLTVAHTIFYDYVGKSLTIGANTYKIESVHKHADYVEPEKSLFQGKAAPLMRFLTSRSDIALIKLSSPVSDIKPIDIYPNTQEKGKTITVFGRGATGDGLTGEITETKSLRQLNQFNNVIESAEGHWLTFKFDKPANALPLEGMHASGDSGGASVIFQEGVPYLVGLSSWQRWHGELASFKGGLYGTTAYQVRVSNYLDWILSVLARPDLNS
jgi:hypothetical protein